MRSRAIYFILLSGFCLAGLAPAAMADCPPPPDPGAMALKATPNAPTVTMGDDMVLRPVPRVVDPVAQPLPSARPIKRVPPIIPACARDEKVRGIVDLAFTVRPDGSVADIQVTKEVPIGFGFAEAAVKAVSQWKYEPRVVDGKPVAFPTGVHIASFPAAH